MSFEQGPIRPPSEAASLLIRVNRNCPWNKCGFCPVYKGRHFSRRFVEEIVSDIDEVADAVQQIQERTARLAHAEDTNRCIARFLGTSHPGSAMQAAAWWLLKGQRTVFLQDADPLSMGTEGLIEVLGHLKRRLPGITRVTAYARTATLARRGRERLTMLREAGLDRVHVGIESGSDRVLDLVSKGATFARHVKGGRAAVEAGLELSAYVMPGLGGAALSEEHAVQSARCIAEVRPDFTRLRTLAITRRAPLAWEAERGNLLVMDDDSVVREIRLFIQGLDGVHTMLRSDHILNLIGDLEGDLPDDHGRLMRKVDGYLGMSDKDRLLYRIGRRAGLLHGIEDLDDPAHRNRAEALLHEVGEDPANVDRACRELMEQWV